MRSAINIILSIVVILFIFSLFFSFRKLFKENKTSVTCNILAIFIILFSIPILVLLIIDDEVGNYIALGFSILNLAFALADAIVSPILLKLSRKKS